MRTQMSENNSNVLTPYGAAKVANQALKEAGIERVLPPQMFYNYTTARVRAGKNPLIAYTEKGGVDRKALNEWVTKYIAKASVTVEG
jgi:hypothetical protein